MINNKYWPSLSNCITPETIESELCTTKNLVIVSMGVTKPTTSNSDANINNQRK